MTHDKIPKRRYHSPIQPRQYLRESRVEIPVCNGFPGVIFIFGDKSSDGNLRLADDKGGANTYNHASSHC